MTLDENQKLQVPQWLNNGLKLAEVQKKLEQDFGIKMTYMEVKFLMSDLDLRPKDPVPEPTAPQPASSKSADPEVGDETAETPFPKDELPASAASTVKIAVDQITRPGAMISGKATFANGKTCEWMLDQMGRLGLIPSADGFKPRTAEVQAFQIALQTELQKLGY